MRKDQCTHKPGVLGESGSSTAKALVWLVRSGKPGWAGQFANTTTRIVHFFFHNQVTSLVVGFFVVGF